MPLVHTCCFLEPARLIAAIDLCELPPQPSAEPPMAVNATEGIRAGFHGVTAQSAALHYFIIYSPNSGTAENGVQGDNRRWSLPHSGTAENGVQAGGSEREHTTVDEARQGEVGVCDRYRTPVSTPLYAVHLDRMIQVLLSPRLSISSDCPNEGTKTERKYSTSGLS